ncbi:MAG: YceH family protein [Xanthomonadales bacterium]|nr:YceH family protein [Xanthomonadales bacterium]
MSDSTVERPLSEIQVRVLGCLVEKEATTPDQYPLTINALRSACNQKTARDPVMSCEEGEVGHAVRQLEEMGLTHQAWSARAARWEHRMGKGFGFRPKDLAVMATLMLRGPQTAAEIRSHCGRLFEFEDVDDVEYVLGRLMERDPPLVVQLPRLPGQKGVRYMHLLCGEPDLEALAAAAPAPAATRSALEERVSRLESEVAELKSIIATWSDED